MLACDHWTSVANQTFLGINCFIADNGKLKTYTLGIYHCTESKTAENIAEHVRTILHQWNIQGKVHHMISDNAANIVKAVKLVPLIHLPCMAHTFQLAINNGLAKAGIETTLAKCRKIVGHYKHSSLRLMELKRIINEPADDNQHIGDENNSCDIMEVTAESYDDNAERNERARLKTVLVNYKVLLFIFSC